jgi:ABC-type branched-subunit amino acid transport system ATPase component
MTVSANLELGVSNIRTGKRVRAQQMVAVGQAPMCEPRLLLLDEPSTGLAPRVISALHCSLAALYGTGVSILVAEQNAEAPLKFALSKHMFVQERILRSMRAICGTPNTAPMTR